MTSSNIMLIVSGVIALSTLTVLIVQFVRSRRNPDEPDSTNWWEGPWDGDKKE